MAAGPATTKFIPPHPSQIFLEVGIFVCVGSHQALARCPLRLLQPDVERTEMLFKLRDGPYSRAVLHPHGVGIRQAGVTDRVRVAMRSGSGREKAMGPRGNSPSDFSGNSAI